MPLSDGIYFHRKTKTHDTVESAVYGNRGGQESIGTYYASPKSQFLVPPCLIYVEMLGISAYLIDKNDKTTRTELRSWWDIASKGDKVPSIRNFPRDSRHILVAVGAHCFGGPRNKQVNAM